MRTRPDPGPGPGASPAEAPEVKGGLLAAYTDGQPREELQRREDERDRADLRARREHNALLGRHVEALLELVPGHGPLGGSGDSCSGHGSARCRLLIIRHDRDMMDELVLRVHVDYSELRDPDEKGY